METNWSGVIPLSSVDSVKERYSIAYLKGLVQISMPTSVTELTNAVSPGQYESLSTNLPTRDDLRFGEVDLEEPPTGQETVAPSLVPLLPSGIFVDPLKNTTTRLPSRSDPVSEPVRRDSDVPFDESYVAPGSVQISPRDLTRSQGELGSKFFGKLQSDNCETPNCW